MVTAWRRWWSAARGGGSRTSECERVSGSWHLYIAEPRLDARWHMVQNTNNFPVRLDRPAGFSGLGLAQDYPQTIVLAKRLTIVNLRQERWIGDLGPEWMFSVTFGEAPLVPFFERHG